jgi:hypothetical protein
MTIGGLCTVASFTSPTIDAVAPSQTLHLPKEGLSCRFWDPGVGDNVVEDINESADHFRLARIGRVQTVSAVDSVLSTSCTFRCRIAMPR